MEEVMSVIMNEGGLPAKIIGAALHFVAECFLNISEYFLDKQIRFCL